MSIADDIAKLRELRDAGDLTDEEYKRAKALLLSPDAAGRPLETEEPERTGELLSPGEDSLGRAANRYVSLQIVMAAVGVAFLLFLMILALTMHANTTAEMQRMRSPFFAAPYSITVEP